MDTKLYRCVAYDENGQIASACVVPDNAEPGWEDGVALGLLVGRGERWQVESLLFVHGLRYSHTAGKVQFFREF